MHGYSRTFCHTLLGIVVALAIACMVWPAWSQEENTTVWPDGENCGDQPVMMLRGLLRGFDEHVIGTEDMGLGRMRLLLVSPAGTWTIIILHSKVEACIVEAGKEWAIPTTWWPEI